MMIVIYTITYRNNKSIGQLWITFKLKYMEENNNQIYKMLNEMSENIGRLITNFCQLIWKKIIK